MSAADIAQAQEAMNAAQVVKPDSTELEAIKTFCSNEVKQKTLTKTITETIKALRAQQKSLKEALTVDLGQNKCMAVPKSLKTEDLPPYLRLVKANKDSPITSEVIQEALASVTDEDIREASGPDQSSSQTIRQLVLTNVRRIIRGFTESLKIMASIERGTTMYDLPECSPETVARMKALWQIDQDIKKQLDAKKTILSTMEASSDLKQRIESFFVRTGLTAQRLVVEGQAYRLVRRISIRRQKIGIGKLETLLDEALQNFDFEAFKPIELAHQLQIQISSLPPETKTNVVLCSVKASNS
jgi:hypothetical protein